jgi:Reverse transcriptase (RNA-dependent DNA polymerase)
MFEAAIKAELQQTIDEVVYEIVHYKDINDAIRIIGTMIVLQVKRKTDGTIDKYKARLVALGNQQLKEQFDKIKSPTARTASVKMLVAIQAKLNALSCVMDVKGA